MKETDLLMEQALASSTAKIYEKHVSMFKNFCKHLKIDISQGFNCRAVELWLTKLHKEGVAYSTVRARLSALRHYCTRKNMDSGTDTPRIKLILRGIKKNATDRGGKAVVTLSHLTRLIETSGKVLSMRKHIRFAAMITVAFFGFLRPSEYCVSRVGHELQWSDVKFSKTSKSMRLTFSSFKHSTGPAKVQLVEMKKGYCPVKLMKQYQELYVNSHGSALFNVYQKEFACTLKKLCNYAKIKSHLTPHCFRHGGASWAGSQGWSDAQIRIHGRWKSDAFKRYVHPLL